MINGAGCIGQYPNQAIEVPVGQRVINATLSVRPQFAPTIAIIPRVNPTVKRLPRL